MKKNKLLLLTSIFLLTSCGGKGVNSSIPEDSSSASSDITTSENGSSSSDVTTSTSTSTGTSSDVTTSTGGGSTSTSTSTSTDSSSEDTNIAISSISEIRLLGEGLANDTVGELVKFRATFLKTITLARTSEDLMYFADANASIYLRVDYGDYTGYLAQRYTNKEYEVIANVSKLNNVVELVLNSSLTPQQSVVNYSDTTSVDLDNISTSLTNLGELADKYDSIALDRKKCGTGEIVTFTGKVLETEYTDANKKAVFGDGEGIITVISDSKFVSHEYDLGKEYKVTGILNIQVTGPAILYLDSEVVNSTPTSIDTSKAIEVSPTFLTSSYILSDKYYSPSNEQYTALYKTTGYIVDNTDYNNGEHHLGIVETQSGSISDNGGKKSVDGLLLVNHYGIDERSFSYSPLYDYYNLDEQVTIYFTIQNYVSGEHGWKVFPIEQLIEELPSI